MSLNEDGEMMMSIDEIDAKLSDIWRKSKPQSKLFNASLPYEPGSEYAMTHKRRGKCLIFNHQLFDCKTLTERKGTSLDAHALKKAFTILGFEVKLYNDATAPEVMALLKATSKEDHSDADCFACCIMTHGDYANLWAKNDKYPCDTVFNFFTADNCPTLAGKPKLFFIQACRGDKLDPGVILKVGQDETDSAKFYTLPAWADFLISYSTVPGYYSWRNTRDGSWYMQTLAQALVERASYSSFLSVLTRVNQRVAFDFISQVPTDEQFDRMKQVPSTVFMLTRELIFRPKDVPERPPSIQNPFNSEATRIVSKTAIEKLSEQVNEVNITEKGDQKELKNSTNSTNSQTQSSHK